MTNRTITLSYTNPVQMPHVTRVTEGGRQLTGDTAKNVEAVVNSILEQYHKKRKSNNSEFFPRMVTSPKLEVSLELSNETVSKINLVYSEIGNKRFVIKKFSEKTSNALKTALVVQPTPVHSPKPRAPIPSLHPTQTSARPTRSLSPREPIKRGPNPTRVDRTPATQPPATSISVPMYVCFLVFAFFAAIGRGIRSLFSSNQQGSSSTNETTKLIPKTEAVVPASPPKDLTAIRPLRNGNNICFINAVFQALMNAPEEMKTALIAAHEAKIQNEKAQLQEIDDCISDEEKELKKIDDRRQKWIEDSSWRLYFNPNDAYDKIMTERKAKLDDISELRAKKGPIELLMNASITLNRALSIYSDESNNFVWLNDLRGFDPTFSGSSQQDACQLLDRIFEPLNPELLPLFGEETQLISYKPEEDETEAKKAELALRKDISPFPVNGLQKSVEPNPIVRIDIPKKPIALQTLLDQKFTMRKGVAAELFSFTENEQPGWYKVTEGRLVLETKNKKAPEFIPLQLKRFKSDMSRHTSKVSTPIELPEDNKLTLIVNGQNVNYEIQSLVMQEGTLSGGHYYSYVKKGNDWYEANDSHVARLRQLPDNANQAYMLFLRKV